MYDLPAAAARVFAAGPGMVLAGRDDLARADFIDLQTGEATWSVDFEGVLQSVVPFRSSDGSHALVVISRRDDAYAMSILQRGTLKPVAPNVIPGQFIAPDVAVVTDANGVPAFVVWDKDPSTQFYRRVSLSGDVEDFGLKLPYFQFVNFGDDMLLGLDPVSEVADLILDDHAEDSIYLPGLRFSSQTNFAAFVPELETGGTGKVAIANSETGALSVLAKEVTRLPRIGLPTQVPIRSINTGGRLLLLGSPDLSLILVAQQGSRSMTSFREVETLGVTRGITKGTSGPSSSGGGLQTGNPFELDAPVRDAILGSTRDGAPQFIFLLGDGTSLATAMVDAVALAVEVAVDPSTDVPFSAGANDVQSIMRLQKALASLGYPIGAIDGMLGPATNGAVRSFQVSMGLTASGSFDEETAAALNMTLDDTEFSSADEALAYFSPAQLKGAIGDRPERYKHVATLVSALYEGGYHGRNALAALLANVIYETSNLRVFEESKATAAKLYEGRVNLGNTSPGDGERYRGRGYLMIVGRFNYERYGRLVGVNLVDDPDRTLDPSISAKIAVNIFQDLVPPDSLDSGYVNLSAIRKRVNGGMNGVAEVTRLYRSLLQGS